MRVIPIHHSAPVLLASVPRQEPAQARAGVDVGVHVCTGVILLQASPPRVQDHRFSLHLRVRPTPISASGSSARCYGNCTPAFAPALTFGPGVSMMLAYKLMSVCCGQSSVSWNTAVYKEWGAMLHKVPGEVGQPGIPSRGKVRSEKDHSPPIQEARMVRAGTTGR